MSSAAAMAEPREGVESCGELPCKRRGGGGGGAQESQEEEQAGRQEEQTRRPPANTTGQADYRDEQGGGDAERCGES